MGVLLPNAISPGPTPDNYYKELLKCTRRLLRSSLEGNEFEEKLRDLYGTSSYLAFTLDKLLQTLVKQVISIAGDPRCTELLDMYFKDRTKDRTSPRQEAVYRLSAEALIPDENIYRLEYVRTHLYVYPIFLHEKDYVELINRLWQFIGEKVLTLQLLGRDDYLSDNAISNEERWSLYVDHFVQLGATEGIRLQRNEPFLKRYGGFLFFAHAASGNLIKMFGNLF